ncbi:MAG: hypothetical protein IIA73_11615, partial [Proteobacteria bacterium]|nr:hypothetical protein [Pseudomonadota bacterium]
MFKGSKPALPRSLMPMRARVMVRTLLGMLLVPAILAPRPGLAQSGDGPVVAIVDGEPIHRAEVMAEMGTLPAHYRELPLETLYPVVLNRIIDARLLLAEALRRRLDEDPRVRRRIARMRDRLIKEELLDRHVRANVTEAAVRAGYQDYLTENPDNASEAEFQIALMAVFLDGKSLPLRRRSVQVLERLAQHATVNDHAHDAEAAAQDLHADVLAIQRQKGGTERAVESVGEGMRVQPGGIDAGQYGVAGRRHGKRSRTGSPVVQTDAAGFPPVMIVRAELPPRIELFSRRARALLVGLANLFGELPPRGPEGFGVDLIEPGQSLEDGHRIV